MCFGPGVSRVGVFQATLHPSWPLGLSRFRAQTCHWCSGTPWRLGRPDPRHSPVWLEGGSWIWLTQPPLCDCPLLAGAGLLCIANALVLEAAALSERGSVEFGFVFIPMLAGPAAQLIAEFPGCPSLTGPVWREPWHPTHGGGNSGSVTCWASVSSSGKRA